MKQLTPLLFAQHKAQNPWARQISAEMMLSFFLPLPRE
jgi:hypothetical protein